MTTQKYDTPTFNQTYQFYRYINANPASALAIQFVNTITAAQSQASEEAATAEIDSFFRKTGIYSAVSLASFLEMAEWLFSTLPAWAGFAKHYTYHLKIAGANGAQDAGKVVFNQTGGEDEAYSITYLALDGSKTPLYYQAAQLVDDLTAGNPAVRLQTNFAALGLFTGNPDDAETPVPVLCGTVHGQQSLALFAQNDGDGQSNELTAADILGLVYGCLMITIGLIGIIYKAVTHFRDKRRWEEAHNSANRSYEGGEPAQKKSGEGEKAYDKDLQKTSEDDWIVRDMVFGGLYAHTGIKKMMRLQKSLKITQRLNIQRFQHQIVTG